MAKKSHNSKRERTELDVTSKAILAFLGICVAGLLCFVCYRGYGSMKSATESLQKEEEEAKAFEESIKGGQYTLPDYAELEATPSAEDAPTEKVEGTIGYDAYYELSKKEIAESLEKNRGIIGDEVYNALVAGMDTEYFKKSIEYNYNDMLNEMKDLFEEAWVSSALYDRYVSEGIEVPNYENIECSQEDCPLKKYIVNYTKGDVFDYLMEAHNKWEADKQVEANRNSVDSTYMNLFYQDAICNDYNYLEDVAVDVILLNSETAGFGLDALQEAYDEGLLEVRHLNYTDNKEAIEKLSLYKDIDYYDDNIKDLATDTIQALFGNDLASNSYYLGNFDSLSENKNQEDLTEAIDNMRDYQGDEGGIDYNSLNYWHAETLSLTNRNPEDVLYILWKIVPGSCRHSENIPTQEDMYEELYPKAKMYVADSLIADAIYAELNNLDEETVHSLLRDKYGITIPYSTDDDTENDIEDNTEDNTEPEDGSAPMAGIHS